MISIVLETGGDTICGFVKPVNKVTVLAPCLALFSLVPAVVVVVAASWRKPEN
jgi:hypothetical protein